MIDEALLWNILYLFCINICKIMSWFISSELVSKSVLPWADYGRGIQNVILRHDCRWWDRLLTQGARPGVNYKHPKLSLNLHNSAANPRHGWRVFSEGKFPTLRSPSHSRGGHGDPQHNSCIVELLSASAASAVWSPSSGRSLEWDAETRVCLYCY